MSVRQFLIDHEFIAPHDMPSPSGQYRITCPECGNPKQKCYVDGAGAGLHCFHCGYGASWRGFVRRYEPPSPTEAALERFVAVCQESLTPEVLKYLNDRGLSNDTIRSARLGYAADEELGVPTLDDIEAKLAYDSGRWALRGRIIIPYIQDGYVRSVRGRIFDSSDPNAPKYKGLSGIDSGVYSPEPPDYALPVICTEGEFDALILKQSGFQVLGSPGANQAGLAPLLNRFQKKYLCFDGDDAGRTGMETLRSKLYEHYEIILPDGQDVTDYIRNYGVDSFENLVKNAHLYIEGRPQEDDSLSHSIEAWADWAWSNGEILGPKISWAPRLEKALSGWSKGLFLVGALPNCLEVGTEVLMYDGTRKKVEEVVIGDKLMGPDSKPRMVKETFSGETELHTVYPTYGEPYTVTFNHRLAVKHFGVNNKKHFPMTPQEFYAQPHYIQKKIKGFKVGVEWEYSPTEIDPYYLGVWLGDGFRAGTSIENMEPEIEEFLQNYAFKLGLICKKRTHINSKSSCYSIVSSGSGVKNKLLTNLQQANLIGNKHIPQNYLINNRATRLQILAGLLDTDGYLDPNGYYEITQKNETLAHNIVFLARSLGYFASIHKVIKVCANNGVSGDYFRIRINGNLKDVPCRVSRKRYSTPWKTDKDLLSSSIVVEPKGYGKYAGFTVDQDNMFLLGDFTVTYNSGKSSFFVKSAYEAAKDNPDDTVVAYISLDDDQEDAITRLVAMHSNISFEKIRSPRWNFDNPDDPTRRDPQALQQFYKSLDSLKGMQNLIFRDARYGRSLNYLRNYFKSLRTRYPEKHIIFFVDSLAKVTSEGENQDDKLGLHNWKAYLATELKYLSTVYDLNITTPADFRKINDARRPTNDDLKDAAELAYEANAVMLGFNEVLVKGEDSALLKWTSPLDNLTYPILELNMSKNKKSLYRGAIRFKFYPPTSQFLELTEEEDRIFSAQVARMARPPRGRVEQNYNLNGSISDPVSVYTQW